MESAAAGQGHERGADLCLCLREYSNSQALAKGIKAGVGVESINCEFTEADEMEKCDGFIIGSPTLEGICHPSATTLGIVLSTAAKAS